MMDPQRLRDLADTLDGDDWQHPLGSAALCREAADELERLRAALRLYIARASCTPWPEITAADVQSAIDGAAELGVTPAEKGGGDGDAA